MLIATAGHQVPETAKNDSAESERAPRCTGHAPRDPALRVRLVEEERDHGEHDARDDRQPRPPGRARFVLG